MSEDLKELLSKARSEEVLALATVALCRRMDTLTVCVSQRLDTQVDLLERLVNAMLQPVTAHSLLPPTCGPGLIEMTPREAEALHQCLEADTRPNTSPTPLELRLAAQELRAASDLFAARGAEVLTLERVEGMLDLVQAAHNHACSGGWCVPAPVLTERSIQTQHWIVQRYLAQRFAEYVKS